MGESTYLCGIKKPYKNLSMKKISIIEAREEVRGIVDGLGYKGIGEEEMRYYVSYGQRVLGKVGGELEMSDKASFDFEEGKALLDKTFEMRAIMVMREMRTKWELEIGGNVSDNEEKGGGEIWYMA